MSPPRLVLCWSLFVSSLAFAQPPEEWTPYTPPAQETPTPPPIVPAPTSRPARPAVPAPPKARRPEKAPEPQEAPDPGELIPRRRPSEGFQTALRLLVTPWAGSVTGMMGLVVGSIPTTLGALPFCLGTDGFEERRCGAAVLTGLTLSYTVGVSMGVTGTGRFMGGQGDGLATFLGSLSGAAVAAGIGVATDNIGLFILSALVGPIIGAVAAYEISHAVLTRPDPPEHQARAGFHVMPVVGTTPRGGFLGGLAARF
ncbi:hypothetical protein [Hyalangium versicolor]|uniref:hypothetical protein n=1 Tax=Hyalangium versicolor TaxID=2861190 RepID=UPI001CCFD0F0|nr:hypothetical protein [Hyalangium versicolor]